jgi:GT2 family glycosyltransferase
VSILIVNFNGARVLKNCLDSLQRCGYADREVIVVDNASSDGSLDLLRKYPWAKVIRSETNLGFAGGNNLGLRHCTGDYVLLLNNDTVVCAGFLEALCQYLSQNVRVAIVQGKMVLPALGNRLDTCGSFLTWLGLPYHYGHYKLDGPKYDKSYPIFSAKGACLLFRRWIIPRVGGFLFDDAFFCYYEETDLCHRAWLAGFEVHFVNSPAIEHFMGSTSGSPHAAFVLRHYLRNMAFSLLSNLSWWSRARILPLFFTVLIVSSIGAVLKMQWKRALAHWEALVWCVRRYPQVKARRRLLKSVRQTSDSAIFNKVLRTPRLAYFVKTFNDRLAEYVDDEIPSSVVSHK